MNPKAASALKGTPSLRSGAADAWLSRLLGLWLASFAGLLVFLYMALVGWDLNGRSMVQFLLK